LPIGGLKEKLLAAARGGIKTVLIPYENVRDLSEISEEVKAGLDIHPVQWIDEVFKIALESLPTESDEPLAEISMKGAEMEKIIADKETSKQILKKGQKRH
jgi:ATP-dependent Lon protease